MKFKYRGKEYDTDETLYVNNMRDFGAYIIIRYPQIGAERFLVDKNWEGFLAIYLFGPEGRLTRDNLIHMPSNVLFTSPKFFRELEERLEKVLIKRGFI